MMKKQKNEDSDYQESSQSKEESEEVKTTFCYVPGEGKICTYNFTDHEYFETEIESEDLVIDDCNRLTVGPENDQLFMLGGGMADESDMIS